MYPSSSPLSYIISPLPVTLYIRGVGSMTTYLPNFPRLSTCLNFKKKKIY